MLRAKLQEDLLAALKSGQKDRLDTLRFIMARVKNQEIDKKHELDDTETVDVLRKVKRELDESIEAFEKGARNDLASASKAQLEIVTSYLPAEMSDEELKSALEEIKSKNAELAQANPKALIGICIRELKGKVDSSRIVKMLQETS